MPNFFSFLVMGNRGSTPATNQTLVEVLDFSTATYESIDATYLSSAELDFSVATYED